MLQGSLFENDVDILTSSAPGFRVSQHPWQEREKGQVMIAGCGLSFCAWCLKSIPCSCWRKTLAESLHFALKECNSANGLRVSLRLEVTNCSPSSWLLKTLAHRSEESEFSSWRTPTREEAGARVETLFTKDGQPATTGQRAYRLQPDGRSVLQSVTLNQQVAMMWPTPAAMNPNDGEDLATWLARRERLKETAKNGNGCGTPLAIAIQMWPTPTARDYKNVGNQESMERRRQDIAQPLPEVVINGQPDPDSLNMTGRSRALLNPRWVAQLQGFPSDWLDGIEWPL